MKLYLEGEVYENNRDCPSVLCLCVGPVWADYNRVPPNVPPASIRLYFTQNKNPKRN